jgi:hypothetical protein
VVVAGEEADPLRELGAREEAAVGAVGFVHRPLHAGKPNATGAI